MDKNVLIGMGMIFAVFGFALAGKPGSHLFIHPASMIIVMGGTIAATVLHYPMDQIALSGARVKAYMKGKKPNYSDDIKMITEFADKIKKQGVLAIASDVELLPDVFMRTSLSLLIDNVPEARIDELMRENMTYIAKRHSVGIQMFDQMAKYAPGYGLLGTLIGLVLLMSNLDDPSTLGPAMAVAMITTFYGSFLANVIFTPLAGRLRVFSQQEIVEKELILEGVKSLARGESSFVVKETLTMFLSEKQRTLVNLNIDGESAK